MALLCRRQWGENLSGRIPGELLLAASMYFFEDIGNPFGSSFHRNDW